MIALLCTDAAHASRSSDPRWTATIGMAERQIAGVLCTVCHEARESGAINDDTHAEAAIMIWRDGRCQAYRVRKLADGTVIGVRSTPIGNVQDSTLTTGPTGERVTLRNLLTKLTQWLVGLG